MPWPTYDGHANLADTTVAVAPSPALSGTSLTLASGTGAWFPVGTFNVTVCSASVQPNRSNAEIVRATRATGSDVLTIVRAQEGTSARSIAVGDRIFLPVTAKTLTDIETATTMEGTVLWVVKALPTFGSAAGSWPTAHPAGSRTDVVAVWVGPEPGPSVAHPYDQRIVTP